MKEIDEITAQAFKEAERRNDAFFEYFGIRGEERLLAANEHAIFCEDVNESKLGHSFYNTPLAMKAFMVGYFRGRSCFRPQTGKDQKK